MPETTLPCPRCRGVMDRGFVIDRGDYSIPETQKWVDGEPKRTFWAGVTLKNRRVIAVNTYRCAECGFLESYANGESA